MNDQILPTAAVTIRALTVHASLGPPELSVSQRHQTVYPRFSNDDDTPAVAAVPSIRTASWNVTFAAKTDATSSAITSLHFDFYSINKHQQKRTPETGRPEMNGFAKCPCLSQPERH
jgi:hypothetical protein